MVKENICCYCLFSNRVLIILKCGKNKNEVYEFLGECVIDVFIMF